MMSNTNNAMDVSESTTMKPEANITGKREASDNEEHESKMKKPRFADNEDNKSKMLRDAIEDKQNAETVVKIANDAFSLLKASYVKAHDRLTECKEAAIRAKTEFHYHPNDETSATDAESTVAAQNAAEADFAQVRETVKAAEAKLTEAETRLVAATSKMMIALLIVEGGVVIHDGEVDDFGFIKQMVISMMKLASHYEIKLTEAVWNRMSIIFMYHFDKANTALLTYKNDLIATLPMLRTRTLTVHSERADQKDPKCDKCVENQDSEFELAMEALNARNDANEFNKPVFVTTSIGDAFTNALLEAFDAGNKKKFVTIYSGAYNVRGSGDNLLKLMSHPNVIPLDVADYPMMLSLSHAKLSRDWHIPHEKLQHCDFEMMNSTRQSVMRVIGAMNSLLIKPSSVFDNKSINIDRLNEEYKKVEEANFEMHKVNAYLDLLEPHKKDVKKFKQTLIDKHPSGNKKFWSDYAFADNWIGFVLSFGLGVPPGIKFRVQRGTLKVENGVHVMKEGQGPHRRYVLDASTDVSALVQHVQEKMSDLFTVEFSLGPL